MSTTKPRLRSAAAGTNLLPSSNRTYLSCAGVTLAGLDSSSLVGSGFFFSFSSSSSSLASPSTSMPSASPSFFSPSTSMPSVSLPSSLAFLAALALALAVVERTALTSLPLSFLSSRLIAAG